MRSWTLAVPMALAVCGCSWLFPTRLPAGRSDLATPSPLPELQSFTGSVLGPEALVGNNASALIANNGNNLISNNGNGLVANNVG
ncbi:MAG: hypothetical protein KGR26_05225, partial [Cyanobacteria bacterium REEB65]|nr:hypothetical protein [Cyanobacteria bacterium REEB65]